MKKTILLGWLVMQAAASFAQEAKPLALNPPQTDRGLPVMEALSVRASVREFDSTTLSIQDLSDLLWAANGINRPDEGKRTASSAQNAQDIDVYACMESGCYLYDAAEHVLKPVAEGDHRPHIAGRQEQVTQAPVICLLVSDISRFRSGTDSLKLVWAAIDAGIVSQNISLFCASTGLATRPRASMDQEKLREVLKLKESQHLMLNHPVSYKKD